jgi:hypothetical protein
MRAPEGEPLPAVALDQRERVARAATGKATTQTGTAPGAARTAVLVEATPREVEAAQREAQAVAGARAARVEAAPARLGRERAEREALQVPQAPEREALQVPRAPLEQVVAAGLGESTLERAAVAERAEGPGTAAQAARPALVARPTAVAPMVAGRAPRRPFTVTTSKATRPV